VKEKKKKFGCSLKKEKQESLFFLKKYTILFLNINNNFKLYK
jgi:hypothetical protein